MLASLVAALVVLWWRGPEWDTVYDAFDFVSWRWVLACSPAQPALGRRARVGVERHDPPGDAAAATAASGSVFSAFGVGLLGNAVLPARAGELARVAVLRRHLPEGSGSGRDAARDRLRAPACSTSSRSRCSSATSLLTAKLPHWAVTGVVVVGLVGLGLLDGRGCSRPGVTPAGTLHGRATARRLLAMARQGLAVLRVPSAALARDLLPDRRLDAAASRRLGGDGGVRPRRPAARPPRSCCC